MSKRKSVFICLGSNLNDPVNQLHQALQYLEEKISQIQVASSIYQTEAWGLRKQPDYFNQVVRLTTIRSPAQLLRLLHSIEDQMGRIRSGIWEPRTIDLDILFYGQEIVNKKNLIIPHPRLHERLFNLVPLMEIAPTWFHPVLGKTVAELTLVCTDSLKVRKLMI